MCNSKTHAQKASIEKRNIYRNVSCEFAITKDDNLDVKSFCEDHSFFKFQTNIFWRLLFRSRRYNSECKNVN